MGARSKPVRGSRSPSDQDPLSQNVGIEMSDDTEDAERVALEMIERFGAGAVRIAREQAEAATSVLDAEAWRNVADAIENLLTKP